MFWYYQAARPIDLRKLRAEKNFQAFNSFNQNQALSVVDLVCFHKEHHLERPAFLKDVRVGVSIDNFLLRSSAVEDSRQIDKIHVTVSITRRHFSLGSACSVSDCWQLRLSWMVELIPGALLRSDHIGVIHLIADKGALSCPRRSIEAVITPAINILAHLLLDNVEFVKEIMKGKLHEDISFIENITNTCISKPKSHQNLIGYCDDKTIYPIDQHHIIWQPPPSSWWWWISCGGLFASSTSCWLSFDISALYC